MALPYVHRRWVPGSMGPTAHRQDPKGQGALARLWSFGSPLCPSPRKQKSGGCFVFLLKKTKFPELHFLLKHPRTPRTQRNTGPAASRPHGPLVRGFQMRWVPGSMGPTAHRQDPKGQGALARIGPFGSPLCPSPRKQKSGVCFFFFIKENEAPRVPLPS